MVYSTVSRDRSPNRLTALPIKGLAQVVDDVVQDDKKCGHFLDGVAEFFHQQKHGKGNEYLTSGTAHEGQGIIEPVLPF